MRQVRADHRRRAAVRVPPGPRGRRELPHPVCLARGHRGVRGRRRQLRLGPGAGAGAGGQRLERGTRLEMRFTSAGKDTKLILAVDVLAVNCGC